MSTGGDPTFGDEWIPPLDCLECNHESKRTGLYCNTCRGPFYCFRCNARIADVPPDPAPIIDPPPPPPPDSPPIVEPPPMPTGNP